MFASAQLLCNWREQRSSNKDDIYFSVTGMVGECIARGWPASGFIFAP